MLESVVNVPVMHAVAHNEVAAAKERVDELRREVSRIYVGSSRALDLMLHNKQ